MQGFSLLSQFVRMGDLWRGLISGCSCLHTFHARTSCLSLCRCSSFAIVPTLHVSNVEVFHAVGTPEESLSSRIVALLGWSIALHAGVLWNALQHTCRFLFQERI